MNDDRTKSTAIASLRLYLSQHKQRQTPERFKILDRIFDNAAHFTVDELYQSLCNESFHVSRATVYNAVELFIRCGLVRRVSLGAKPVKYERNLSSTKHYHLVCNSCGNIREMRMSEIDTLLTTLKLGKFQPLYADLTVFGICSRCQRKNAAGQSAKNKPGQRPLKINQSQKNNR